jgi:predicted dithiol-disulfide oxidoreductase (DUF899 family)
MADSQALAPATELARKNDARIPGESDEYRRARTALLAEEIELRRHIERVAAQRRALPPGGEIPVDYEFTGEDGRKVHLSEMFGEGDTLVTYIWMYGPGRERPCPMCTAFLGGLEGNARDVMQRVPVAIIGRSPIERQRAFKKERGWRNLRFYSSEGTSFTKDYRGEGADGEDWAAFNVFKRDADGTIRLFWGDEMGMGTADPGQDPRGAPDPMPMWTIFDMTPGGRDPHWYPKLEYGDAGGR